MEPEFLGLEDVLEVHAEALRRNGGQGGLRDHGLLSSAVSQPQASFDGQWLHGDCFEMAAAYAFHLAENQPFLDGNKRTALGSALLFLDLNGIDIDDPSGSLYDAMLAVAAHTLGKAGLAALFRELSEATGDHGK